MSKSRNVGRLATYCMYSTCFSAMSNADVEELRRSMSKTEIKLDEDTEKQSHTSYLRVCATHDETVAPKTRIQRLTAQLAQWGVETNGYVTYHCTVGVA